MNYLFVLAIGIGIVAGLRAMTAPAAVSWAATVGWLNLRFKRAAPIAPDTTATSKRVVFFNGEVVAA